MSNDPLTPVFQVSEFNELINQHLSLLGEVTIEGELTRIDVKNSRLLFLSIKDGTSSLDVFSMSHLIKNIRQFEPGMLVRVTGTPGVYKGTTKFRLFASSMTPQGEGSLQIAFEKLKKQLESEGLFAPERKRPLPLWPTRIGLITAVNSSAYFDLVKIMTARMSGLTLKVLPVNVQGREAVPTILKALNFTNNHPDDFDVIILARGGGSLEDLQAFNSEEIARAIFSSKTPIISAIGHEDNWSLTDYVADLRASTPSNAAELVVRDRAEVVGEINGSIQFIKHRLEILIQNAHKLVINAFHIIRNRSGVVRSELEKMIFSIKTSLTQQLKLTERDVDSLARLLSSLDYQQILNRGFSITKTITGKIIKSTDDVKSDECIITQLATGTITSHVQ